MRTLVCAALLFGILLTGCGGEKEKEKQDASKKSQEQQEMLEKE
jgi:lipoprotein